MNCRIKINNDHDNPLDWIQLGRIQISKFNQNGEKNDLSWLEGTNAKYHKFTSLNTGDSIYIFNNESYLTFKFIVNGTYQTQFHGYYVKQVFKCCNKVCLFSDPNCPYKRNKWLSCAQETINRYEDEAQWEEIKAESLETGIINNLKTYSNLNEKQIFNEGQVVEKTFKYFNRDRTLRDIYFEKHDKKCCLCGKKYPKADGNDTIIDLHHLHAIHLGAREVVAQDIDKYLVALCPNCHRWVHSIKTDHELTFNEIVEIYKKFLENNN